MINRFYFATVTCARHRRTGFWRRISALASATLLALMSDSRAAEDIGTFFGAHMQTPKVATTPAADGTVDVTCTVPLLGGCCFPLTSHNVTAVLVAPAGVTVLSGPEPASYPAIEAPVSGTPKVWAVFRWRLKRANPHDEVPLTITVSSPDSGEVKTTYTIGQAATCSVEGPVLPAALPPNRELCLAVTVNSLNEERFVKGVRFWYTTEIPADATGVEIPQDLGSRGILRFSSGGRQLMVQARALDLARKYEPTVWYGTLPVVTQGNLYGFAVATDDAGRASRGPLVRSAGTVATVAASAHEATNAARTIPRRLIRFGALAGISLAFLAVLIRVRRRGIAVLSGVAGSWAVVSAMAWLALAPWPGGTPGASPADFSKSLGYPTNGSALVYLFLDGGDASRQLAERIERYRQAVPHRIHVLCFVEGVTPPSLLAALRDRHQVHQTPGIVFDGHVRTDAGNPAMVDGTLDRCFNKAPPRLSMELHGGVIGNRHFSLGFIMCNHGLPQDARGNTAMFVFENGVSLGEWKCDRIAKYQVADARPFAIPVRKCLPPSMYKWEIPPSVDPARLGALVLVLDEQGHVIDSICTEKPCARTGVCD